MLGSDPWAWAWIFALFALLVAVVVLLDRVSER